MAASISNATALIVGAALYLLFEWQGQWMQLCGAIFAAGVALIFLNRIRTRAHLRYSFRIQNPFSAKLPLDIYRDCLIVAWAVVRNLFGRRIGGRVEERELPEEQSHTSTARAATITAVSAAPTTYALEATDQRIVVHELVGLRGAELK